MANTHSSRTKRNTVSISDGKHTWDKQTNQRRRKLRGSRFLNTGFFGVKQNKKMSPLLANKQSKDIGSSGNLMVNRVEQKLGAVSSRSSQQSVVVAVSSQ